jgi:CYTH domain-containing protein
MEIERKFLVKKLPDLSGIKPAHFERYYLVVSNGIEERIQKVNDRYIFEKKIAVNKLTRSTETKQLTQAEFEKLKGESAKVIIRDSYVLSPGLSIKIYHGDYKGLVRAEVEFASLKEAAAYAPEPWMGKEITDSALGRDSRLLNLDRDSFKQVLAGL